MHVFNKGGTDKTVVMSVREGVIQPFVTGWMDLRIGFLLSLTNSSADDTITGLSETITNVDPLSWFNRYWIGVSTGTDLLDGPFIGFTNNVSGRFSDTALVSSDAEIGTSNTNFWRPKNGFSDNLSAEITDTANNRMIVRWQSTDGIQQHFVQNVAGAGGYATLLMLRLQRPNSGSKQLTVTMKQGTHNGDVLYTSTPTLSLLLTNMEAYPTSVQTGGPIDLSQVPNAIFLYWPFRLSRLRIHAMGMLRAR